MYKKSIKDNSKFLLPFTEGIKYYGSDNIVQGLGTMIALNDEGDVLTCKHIAERFLLNQKLIDRFSIIMEDLSNAKNKNERKKIEKKYNLNTNVVILSNVKAIIDEECDCNKYNIILHPYLDMAIIRFNKKIKKTNNYPIFSTALPDQGQSICRIGYAFPEYDLYDFSKEKNNIVLKQDSKLNFPVFPNDGIVTRRIIDEKNIVSMFETSTPGLRGQSGGPIFGPDGIIFGMQSMTKHLDLNFDINQDVMRGAVKKRITFTPFINLGVAISSVEIIKFLKSNNIKFFSK